MGSIRWTEEQERAISVRGRHVLVSAAAGSGKTAVLVERILRRVVEEQGDVDRLLVVTFTDAAAAQMRDRLVERLHEGLAAAPGDPHLLRQLMLLPGASISTLHAFCLHVVRRHFYRLGLDPALRILDEHEARLLRLEALEATLEGLYENIDSDDAFAGLVAAYGGVEGDEALQQIMLDMHDYSRSLPDPKGWLERSVAGYGDVAADTFDETPWAAELQRLAEVRIAQARRLVAQALDAASGPGGSPRHAETYAEDLERLDRLLTAAATGWSALTAAADLCTFGRLRSARGDDSDPDVRKRGTGLRNRAKKIVEEGVRDGLLSRDVEAETAALRAAAPAFKALVRAVGSLDEAYAAAKAERGFIDFGDIEHMCLRLLRIPEVAAEMRSRFDEVLVDECQDLNGVQDAILAAVSRPPEEGGELFLVGDVKQSVYRFRQADPGLFLARYERAVPDPGPAADDRSGELRIDLQSNFRSRPTILHGVNFLFRQLMTEGAGEMEYGPDAELRAGRVFDPAAADSPVELHVLERERWPAPDASEERAAGDEGRGGAEFFDDDSPEEQDLSAFQREARYVAEHIRHLVREERTPVWDADLGRYRPVRYGDVVVLLRAAKGRDNELIERLQAVGVPAYAELATGYFAATEVDTMLALLRVLDNPRQDIPLAAVLRVVVGMTPEDLARLRLSNREGDLYDAVVVAGSGGDTGPDGSLGRRARQFLRRLDRWRTAARRKPLSQVVWRLLSETRLFDYVGALPGGRQRQANLRALYERARQFNHFSRHGLSRFLRFIERLQDAEGDLGVAPALGEADDVVRVMSVHKSKGLQFPVVYVLDVGRDMWSGGPRGRRGDLLFHRELGLGAARVDSSRRIVQPSLPLEAVKWRRRREELAEEMRLLYVALTRAQERLVVVGSVENIDKRAADWAEAASRTGWRLPDERLLTATSWMDWIGPAVIRHREGEPLRRRAEAQLGGPVEPRDGEVAADASRWCVRVAPPAPPSGEKDREPSPPLPWADVAALRPLPDGLFSKKAEPESPAEPEVPAESEAPDELETLRRRIDWTYPHRAVVGRAAKQSVSELKRRWDAFGAEETVPVAPRRRRLEERPAFLHAAGRPLTAAERGAAVHLVLQHVDLTGELDRDGLAEQIEEMRARRMLTAEQAAAVDLGPLADFFASDLGRRLRSRPERVERETPFTMALPATEAYPDLDPRDGEGETVVVQGIIDCLIVDDDGLLLLDFKTDRVSAAAVPEAAAGYTSQIALYARAAARMYRRPVREAYVVFLAPGRAARLDPPFHPRSARQHIQPLTRADKK